MATRIRGIVANLGVRTPELRQGLQRARRDWRTYSRAVQSDVQTLSRVTRVATTAIIGSLALVGRAAFQSADEIAKASRNLEVNANQYQILAQAARQSGSNVEALGTAFNTFNRNLEEGRLGTESAVRAFNALGLSAQEFIGLDFFSQVRLLGPALESVDTSTRIWAAGILLGEENARRLNATLETLGDESLRLIAERMTNAGAIIEDDLLPFVEELNDQLSLLGPAIQAGFLRGIAGAGFQIDDFSEVVGRIGNAVQIATNAIARFGMFLFEHIQTITRVTAAYVLLRTTAFGAGLIANIGNVVVSIAALSAAYLRAGLAAGNLLTTKSAVQAQTAALSATTAANTVVTAANTRAQVANAAATAATAASVQGLRAGIAALTGFRAVLAATARTLGVLAVQTGVAFLAFGLLAGAVVVIIELFQNGFGPSIGRIIQRITLQVRLLGNTIDLEFSRLAQSLGEPFRVLSDLLVDLENNLRGLRNATFGRIPGAGILPEVESTDFAQAEQILIRQRMTLERSLDELGGSLIEDAGGVFTDVADLIGRTFDRVTGVVSPLIDAYRTVIDVARTGELPDFFSTDQLNEQLTEITELLRESTSTPPGRQGDGEPQPTGGGASMTVTPNRGLLDAIDQGSEDFQNALARGLTAGLREGDFSAVGETLRDSLIRSFTTNLGDSLSEAFTGFLTSVLGGIGQGGADNQLFAALGGFLPFQDGGFVPGRTGQAVPILAHAGELVLTPEQQRTLGGTINITLNATGNVDDATRRALFTSGEQIADMVQAQFSERRLLTA